MPTDSNESSILSSTTTTTSIPVIVPSITATSTMNNNGLLPLNHPQSNSLLQLSTKQLNKLKHFLSSLYHFGSDISNDIGERVRTLILALVNNALSVEEFHGKIQATTNFPLRPFALPFLKSTLPYLQKELSQLAHQSKQTISQYIAQHEEIVLLPRDILERNTLSPSKEQINENGKRKASEHLHELDERSYGIKRTLINHHQYPFISSSINTNNNILSSSSSSIRRDKERTTFHTYLRESGSDINNKTIEDDWKTAENMLSYILEMVTKTKRVLFMLQQKDNHLRRLIETNDLEWRRRHTELLTQTEDRIVEIRRKAEETVLEIKRQSILDLQKAVSQTEQKSNEILLHEREQYQRLKAKTFEEAYALLNRQEDGPEQCWHCGRKAIETCSGCNLARYCGQYCQHRDWELHQKCCGPDLKRKYTENPQLYRQNFSKYYRNIPSNQQNDSSPNHLIRRNSDTTPIIVADETTTNDNDKQTDIEKEDTTTVKTENV